MVGLQKRSGIEMLLLGLQQSFKFSGTEGGIESNCQTSNQKRFGGGGCLSEGLLQLKLLPVAAQGDIDQHLTYLQYRSNEFIAQYSPMIFAI